MASCDVFLDMPVNCTDQMSKMLNRLIECSVWPFVKTITLGVIDYESVKMAPIIIKMFDKTIQQMDIPEKYGGLIEYMRDYAAFILYKQ
jgi:hypothetical protein